MFSPSPVLAQFLAAKMGQGLAPVGLPQTGLVKTDALGVPIITRAIGGIDNA